MLFAEDYDDEVENVVVAAVVVEVGKTDVEPA